MIISDLTPSALTGECNESETPEENVAIASLSTLVEDEKHLTEEERENRHLHALQRRADQSERDVARLGSVVRHNLQEARRRLRADLGDLLRILFLLFNLRGRLEDVQRALRFCFG